jgi:isoquinoline 1-oxidoreductase beta subunit
MNAHVDQDAARTGATRREMVVGTALVSGALLVGCGPADLLSVGAKTEVGAFGPFIRIAADGAVTVFNKHIEFGQGTHAGLAAIVAEELDADRRAQQGGDDEPGAPDDGIAAHFPADDPASDDPFAP